MTLMHCVVFCNTTCYIYLDSTLFTPRHIYDFVELSSTKIDNLSNRLHWMQFDAANFSSHFLQQLLDIIHIYFINK